MRWMLSALSILVFQSFLALVFQSFLAAQVSSVPPPGPLQTTHMGFGATFQYPENWTSQQRSINGIATFAPNEARVTTPSGQPFVTHGVYFGFFQTADYVDINAGTELLIQAIKKTEVTFQQVPNKNRSITVGGRPGRAVSFTNFSEMSPEVGTLVTVQAPHGLLFWLMFAPNIDYGAYSGTFNQILSSVRFDAVTASTVVDQGVHQDVVQRIESRLRAGKYKLPPFRVVVSNVNAINAWADTQTQTVNLPITMVHFLEHDEGELAFVISHELGHLLDNNCRALAGQARITAEGQSRFCEQRADELGFQYLTGAGYNPYDAAAEFGRMMMFYGGNGVLESIFGRIASDHPINQDRIDNLRKMLIAQCQREPASCHP